MRIIRTEPGTAKMKLLTVILSCLSFVFILSSLALAQQEPWEQYDFEGETVTVYHSGWFHPQTNFITGEEWDDPRWEEHLDWVEQAFNVNIEFDTEANPWGVAEHITPMVMAGESNFLYATWDQWVPIMANEGMLYPLGDIIDEDYYDRLPDVLSQPLRGSNTFRGEPYAFQFGPVMTAESMGVFFNKDLFAAEGLTSPYELYEAGEWTWDNFADLAVQATQDTTGDGEIDQWGIEHRTGPVDGVLVNFINYSKGGSSVREVDGEFKWTFDEPTAIESMEFWHELVTIEEAVSDSAYSEEFMAGNAAMNLDFSDALVGGFEEMDDAYGLVPFPRGEEVEEHIAPEFGRWLMVIPVTADNPEALFELHHALYQLADPYIEDLESFEEDYFEQGIMNAMDRETVEHFQWLNLNVRPGLPTFWEILQQVPEYGETISEVIEGEQSPTEAMSALQPAVQSHLDDIFEQH